ncbi:GDSL-type esterase/lipase family protein [Calothrix sp. NIES-3974]|uniref:GDSL-type esterase/lipase family protein n=1 Tax=Calothrix sp. NIES-3974 TaxID=2005462 RepID=UPI000B5EF23E|nr:GDSL-type esterase/lipase family protein [Calothrix sp. NIES-3974]BAZ04914.1 GDSL family lipase [Calothrix sp. NIES-3974]
MSTNIINIIIYSSLALNLIFSLILLTLLISKGGWKYLTQKIWNFSNHQQLNYDNTFTPYYIHKSHQFEILANPHHQKIVLLGDSLTDEGEWVELLANPHVINRGISGDTTIRVWKRISAIIKIQPQQLFLMIGVNDLVNTNKSLTQITQDYRQLIQTITTQLPSTEIFLQSIIPVNTTLATFLRTRPRPQVSQDILTLNQNIQAIAQEFQCEYLDIYSHLADEHHQLLPECTTDGIHLNGEGYKIWAGILKQRIQNPSG